MDAAVGVPQPAGGKDLNNDGSNSDRVPGNVATRPADLNLDAVMPIARSMGQPIFRASRQQQLNSLDVRVTRAFRLSGASKVELVAQVFNLMGSNNLLASGGVGGYVNNALSDSFGKILAAGNKQQAEFALRFAW